ncbi:MAG: anaerobic glycerol-3-phosphate dehydrogenase subunit C [Planctomycetota bacterium]|nr:anaerobic glycerol-3-phosphate dehydrogenase subunit C [Planctomycetota bacterium]
MDQERERIQDDLRGLLAGDVRCDDLFLQMYASDASIYEVRPLAVVRPRHARDVVTCVEYAAENNLPVRPRGAGTGLAGESLGSGIVIDFSRYMNRMGLVADDSVRVQPGLVHAELNEHLARSGRIFGPDPAMSTVTTLGSVIAIDAAGSHFLKYGSARHHVRRLQVVLADGSLLELDKEPLQRTDDALPRRRQLVDGVAALLRRDADMIKTFKSDARVNRSGYNLNGVLSDDSVDMARLLVGSEGTLAIITEAILGIDPLPAARGVVLLLFDRLDNAARAVAEVLREQPSACDLIDRRHLSLARESDVRFDLLIPPETEAVLLVEFDGDEVGTIQDRVNVVLSRLQARKSHLIGSRVALDAADVELYWQLARKIVPTLYRLKGSSRPLPFVEDMAVPPEALPEFLTKMIGVLKRHQVTASLFGHAGHGQLHVRPLLNLADRGDVERMEHLANDLYGELFDMGGTISGEHGDGLSRSQFIPRQYGPLYETFRELKAIFDPHNILNPGKKVNAIEASLTRNLRPVGPRRVEESNEPPPELIPLQLNWDTEQLAHAVRTCNGCGACRSQLSDVRMCPIFRLAPREEASPRAKANLLRGILSGRLDPETVATEDFKKIADLCVNCHQCRMECPANVDIPKMMIEAKAAYVSVNGLRPTDYFMTHLDHWSALGCRFHRLANWTIRNRSARWMMERVFGLAQGRKLPGFARQSFLRMAARQKLTRADRGSGNRVVYFVDTFANYHDTALAMALLRVMKHNGVSVYVHPGQWHSAMAMVTHGVLPQARKVAQNNIDVLAEAVRQGYQIVATEPAAASCLVHEYPSLTDHEDAQLVAENTVEACTYLWRMHQSGALRLDLKPLNMTVAYHQPCHLRSLQVGSPGENLMRLIPGLTVVTTEKGCSGMAGTYGLKRENYRSSLRAGLDLITSLRDPRFQAGTTECSTCKMQMEQGTTKPTLHPIKVLAQAYGLMPEDQNPFTTVGEELVVTTGDASAS